MPLYDLILGSQQIDRSFYNMNLMCLIFNSAIDCTQTKKNELIFYLNTN